MSVQGNFLSNIGQAISPAQLAQAYSAFQDIQLKAEKAQRHKNRLVEYDDGKKRMTKGVEAFYKRAEKNNLHYRDDAKSFQAHHTLASSAADGYSRLEQYAQQFKLGERELEMYKNMGLDDLRGAPAMYRKIITDKMNTVRANDASRRMGKVAKAIVEGQASLGDAMANPNFSASDLELLVGNVQKLRSEQTATLDSDRFAKGLAGLIRDKAPPESTNQQIVDLLRGEGVDISIQDIGRIEAIRPHLDIKQAAESDVARGERVIAEDAMEPMNREMGERLLYESAGKKTFDVNLPGLDKPSKWMFDTLGRDHSAISEGTVTPTAKGGTIHSLHASGLQAEVDASGKIFPYLNQKITTFDSPSVTEFIRKDMLNQGGSTFGYIASKEDAEEYNQNLGTDATTVSTGVKTLLRDDQHITQKQRNVLGEVVKDIDSFIADMNGLSDRYIAGTGRLKPKTKFKLTGENYRKETAKRVAKFLELQMRYRGAFGGVRTR